jgi:CubicO group peptidase (beta-lactamase class C family)
MLPTLCLLAVSASVSVGEEPKPERHKADEKVNALLAAIRDKHGLPGIVGGIVRGDKLLAVGAVGVRKTGSPEMMEVDDQVHIGSDTKAMTATRIAMLVEQGKLKWKSTIVEVFPDLKEGIHADFQNVTLGELLTHRAGLPANVLDWWGLGVNKSTTEQRLVALKQVLKKPPMTKPGTKYSYSNVGYGVAAAMAERVTAKSWEELMQEGLFKPLKMSTAGFGAPGSKGKVDQPWGHKLVKAELKAFQLDNAPALGPAGTVHCSLPDWAKFAELHLQGRQGKSKLLKAQTVRYLHTPPEGEEYACGWVVLRRDWAKGSALTHSGNNTMWWATIWIAPERNFAVLSATNRGDDEGQKACDDASAELIGYFEKHLAKKK